jgi:hypothetical protein
MRKFTACDVLEKENKEEAGVGNRMDGYDKGLAAATENEPQPATSFT